MGDTQRSRTDLFMVRVWLEDLGNGKTEWRGKVRHILSDQVCYFRDWHMLEKFLLEALEEPKPIDDSNT